MNQPNTTTTKTQLAKELGIARQTLYYLPKQPDQDEQLKQQILAVMAEHPAYGQRRVALALGMNKKPVRRVMNLFELRPRIRRKQPHKPLDQGRPATSIPNLGYRICPLRPNVLWAGDFTYFWVEDHFIYLATVIDAYTRELVGWHIGNYHTTDLIQRAFADAVARRGSAPKIFHSDQGSEYTSQLFLAMLNYYEVQPSHSKKSSPWQNGFQESLYNQFKLELQADQLPDQGQLIAAIHQQVHYYNTQRIHTVLKMAPQQFFQHYLLNKQII
jgi:putative transposase